MAEAGAIVSLSGPSGSGKSTCARLLDRIGLVSSIDEPIPRELLRRFANAPSSHAMELQKAIVRGRLSSFLALVEGRQSEIIVFDRPVRDDQEVFFRLHQRLGFLSGEEVRELDALAAEVSKSLAALPEVRVGLTAKPQILRERLMVDSAHARPTWLIDSLPQQIGLYRKYFAAYPPDVLIDTSVGSMSALETRMKEIATRTLRCPRWAEEAR